MKRPAPDWPRLQEIAAVVQELKASGHWNKQAFEKLLPEAQQAVHGHAEFLEFICNAAQSFWLDRA